MKRSRKNLIIPLTVTFVLMALLVLFTSRVIFRTAFSSVQELGDDKATAITADLENYLDTAKSVLWLTADTVDHMVEKGATTDEIIEYITRESKRTEQQFDSSYTGIYGVIQGTYVDGVNWVPPADYDPTKRDWYLTTVAAKGDVVIVSPYVDAQTGNVIISVGRALSDHTNALALDLTLSGVQEIVEEIRINDYGYGFVVNQDGMVIAHRNKKENGKDYSTVPERQELFDKVLEVGKGNFDMTIDGEKCTVFVDEVMDQWHLVIITRNSDLYHAPMFLLIVSILINLIVFILISVFYLLGYRNEQKYHARMEELKEIERKKDYEARILKLEKSAADSANKAKSDFLADMSHEIRTPINAILGMNEMILHESEEKSTLDYASNIKSAGDTLLSIINTILDFSKIEDGRMSLIPAEFQTQEFITNLVNSISERAREKDLDFRVDVDESIPSSLMGDDVRISQVIMNLLTNAVKYTQKGYVLLSIRNKGINDGKALLLVSVRDTGIGIRQEDMDKLAISFERLDEQKNRHIEGTGLGISIVTRLLSMMDSELKIKSAYGVGSEFYFELPIEVADPTPLGPYDSNKRSQPRNSQSRIGLRAPEARILLTDDNDMNCKVASNLLKLFGIRPTLCHSGMETIEKMQKNEYDILFLDHMMPEMDGLETLCRLEDGNLIRNTKIIALTANAVVGAREQYLSVGFDDYLSKPIELHELEKLLKKYLPANLIETVYPIPGKDTPDKDIPEKEAPDQVATDKEEAPEQVASEKSLPEELARENDEIMEFPADEDSEADFHSGSFTNAGEESPRNLERLTALGLTVEDGLNYCAGDEAFYYEILSDYIEAAPEKTEKLHDHLKSGNWKEYKVVVHSVKSASKTIGAMDLFEKARELELAAADGNADYVTAHHEDVMKEYKELTDRLKEILQTT